MKTKLLLILLFFSLITEAQTNLVANGNFENWSSSSSQPDNWFRYLNGEASQSVVAQNGTSSVKMKILDGTINFINTGFFPVVANKTYRVTAYHRLVSGTFTSLNFSLYHKPSTFKEEIAKKTDVAFSSGAWTKIEFDYTPTVSENVEVDVWTNGDLNSEILIDNVSVVDVAEIGAQYTLIPDVNFEKKLIALGIDSGVVDGKVLTSKIKTLTTLNVSNSSIIDLTGIQDFVALTSLYTISNNLTSIDVSKNVKLTFFRCDGNKITSLDVSKNTALTDLYCYSNQLSSLDLSKNTALTALDFGSNKLSNLDISKNTALKTVYCNSNQLNNLDINKNTALNTLFCNSNRLSSLNVSNNLSLIELSCYNNKIINLDVTLNTALKRLDISGNQILTLNVSKNTLLQRFYCDINQLRSLDLTKNTALTEFKCSLNKLKRLNLKNGKNSILTLISFTTNPDLSCIQVDDMNYSSTNWPTKKDATASYSSDCAYTTAIPDPNFEDKLIALGIDTDGKNGKVTTANIANVTALDVSNSMILDLSGIQDFDNLKSLNCSQNGLTKIDLSKNPYLTSLNISNNQLSILKVNSNLLLESINCNNNLLKTIDFSNNTKVSEIYCTNNKLISLNLKNGNNSFSSGPSTKNFTNNPSLTCIQVDDVTFSNTNWANYKDATASYNTNCEYYTAIPDPNFEDKLIASGIDTDGKNGKVLTASITNVTSLTVGGNLIADLTGIQDFTSLQYLYCSADRVNNGAFDGKITSLDVSQNIELVSIICSGQKLTTLNVSKNKELKYLELYTNQISSIDLSNNIVLDYLRLEENKLTNLDVSKNISLTSLMVGSNNLTSLNVSSNTALKILNCYYNYLSSLDLSTNTALTYINCGTNSLTTLDLSKNTALTYLDCSQNKISSLDPTQNTALTYLNNYGNKLTNLDVTKNPVLISLKCTYNELSSLDVSKNTALTSLICSFNQLTSLDISKNTALTSVICNTNKLTNLDLTKNTALISINCSYNQIKTLDLSKNTALTSVDCYYNQLTSLDLSKNTALTTLDCNSNVLTSLNLKNGKNTLLINKNLNLRGNLNLSCITVDDVAYANTNWNDIKDTAAVYTTFDCSSITSIPNAAFEDKLIALGIDTDGKNGVVLNSSIANLTSLDISNSTVSDLIGIEGFTALKTLNVSSNLLKTIDLSKNSALTTLNCSNNATLTCIQVADVAVATNNWTTTKDPIANFNLDCRAYTLIPDAKFEAKLIALGIDTIADGKVLTSKINSLKSLSLYNSSITDLTGIQDFVALTSLNCDSNQLTALDVSKNTALTSLTCTSNKLIALDVSKNMALITLHCTSNKLTALDVSKNSSLKDIYIAFNKLTSLDLSQNPNLTLVYCGDNDLIKLNLKNGNNKNFNKNYYMLFGNNPNLSCISVDDIAYSNSNWMSLKDATASYNTECGFDLSSKNFTIETKGESCLGESNGEISIKGNVNLKYSAVINEVIYPFPTDGSVLKVTKMAPGTYIIKITVNGETYEQSFTTTITKGATITGKSSITKKEVSVEISEGTAPYTVFVDGIEQFETNNSTFTVTTKGNGLLEVKTAKACEGVYAAAIDGLDMVLAAYPNPTSGSFEIELPTSKKQVTIEVNTMDGRTISNKNYILENGKAQLTLINEPNGVYIAKIYLDTIKIVKIIKN